MQFSLGLIHKGARRTVTGIGRAYMVYGYGNAVAVAVGIFCVIHSTLPVASNTFYMIWSGL